MTSYKVLIVDDEKPARELLKLHVGKVKELELIGTVSNAIEAKRVLSENTIDYLVKPISFQRFFKSISKAIEFIKVRRMLSGSTVAPVTTSVNHIFIKVENKLVKIDFDHLLYLESFGEYVKFHTSDKMYMTLKTLTSFEKSLPANIFYRLHRSYMVNLNKIDVIEDGTVRIAANRIPISRKLKEEFLQILKNRGVFK